MLCHDSDVCASVKQNTNVMLNASLVETDGDHLSLFHLGTVSITEPKPLFSLVMLDSGCSL